MRGTPGGRQRASGSSLLSESLCCLYSAAAHGCIGPSTPLPIISTFWRIALGAQLPDRSGLPSAVRGAGAVEGPLDVYGSTALFPCWLPSVCRRPSGELTAGVCCAR